MNRLLLFQEKLKAREIDAALITDETSIFYLCGYRFTDGFLIISQEEAFLVTDFRYYEEALAAVSSLFSVVMPKNRMEFLQGVVKEKGFKSIGYENRTLSVSSFNRYSEAVSAEWAPVGDILAEMRTTKSEAEIANIKEAQSITDKAFSHILSVLTPTMTEKDVALELEFFMRKNGAEGASFEIIAVSGAASALPHGKSRAIPLCKGFLTMDFGCTVGGYCSDMTRTVVIGKADEEMKRVYNTVLAAQTAAIKSARPGMTGGELDKVARDIIDNAGYKGAFGHGLGHGVGLDIHEAPSVSGESRLKAGAVITVEPGIYLMGKYGCRIEDMGVLTAEGFENFTKSTKELIELF